MAAVSVRSTRGPNRTAAKPTATAALSSSSDSPPSGPIRRVIEQFFVMELKPVSAEGLSINRLSPLGWLVCKYSLNLEIGLILVMIFRPDCAVAELAIPCQCWCFLWPRLASSLTTLRSVNRGTMWLTPNSTAFWIVKSILSPLDIPWSRVIARGDSTLRSTNCLIETWHERFSIVWIVALYSPPSPLKRVIRWPGFARTTWRR